MSTKKLAKELGLLRQRSQSSDGSKKSLLSDQIFSYLIVIDFESTCWREKNHFGQEIIEFPAVLLNTSTGEIQSEFHTYVQPQEHPVLSAFCTELTGITQGQVEAGVPLHICLSRFSRWLQKLQLEMGVIFPSRRPAPSAPPAAQKLCAFLTWSDWDLGVCLQYECKRKQLRKPDVLNSWIDLRSTYRLFYDRKPRGLSGALHDVGIQFSGREHSGLDDSRNTAQLAARMMRDGCVMKITRSLEKTSPAVKPVFGNSTADSRKANKENAASSCSEESVHSVVSPKTLLSVSCPVLRDCSLLLCSTTLGRLRPLPEPGQPVLTAEEEAAELSGQTEDRCGSYDDVVLEGDAVVMETEGECDRLPVWEESTGDVLFSPGQDRFKGQRTTGGSSATRLSTECLRSRRRRTVDDPNQLKTGSGLCRTNGASLLRPGKICSPSSSGAVPHTKSCFTKPRSSVCVLSSVSANTPRSFSVTAKGGQRVTSPLCACGRRAKRQLVSNGGPNHGRGFYCCSVRRSGSGGPIQKGCEFFKWESAERRSW